MVATNNMTIVTTTTAASPNSVSNYLAEHIWVPILAGIVVLAIVVVITYGVCKISRNQSRYRYVPIEDDLAQSTILIRNKLMSKAAQRDEALLNCSFFLRSSGEYAMVDHLPEIGCRDLKQWFLVRDKERPKLKYLLTIMPKENKMTLSFTSNTEKYINELMVLLEHPYVYPIKEICFQYDMEQVIVLLPYTKGGSIKDHIYQNTSLDSYEMKHSGEKQLQNLRIPLIKLYGRQILEGMMHLKNTGLPYFGHLHSGNVIVEDNVCRITGYENAMLSKPPKLLTHLKKYATEDMKHFDVLCFGHLLFEMATAIELDTALPESRHYLAIKDMELQEILKYIFNMQPAKYPSIKKISQHKFFKTATLSELVLFSPNQLSTLTGVKNLLRSIKKGAAMGRRRRSEASTVDETKFSPFEPRGSERSFASHSSRTRSSTSKATSQQLVPMTTIPSTSEDQTINNSSYQMGDSSNDIQNMLDNTNQKYEDSASSKRSSEKRGKSKGKGRKSKTASINSSAATPADHNVGKPSTEVSALMAEIRTGVKLRRSYADSGEDEAAL